ncbi:hypothetical protein LPJ81_006886 [Coemansia sp. IMI 209127]|nr:hypothetical protein LPJ81_006886 [Coemansia sp. IMI 209127]
MSEFNRFSATIAHQPLFKISSHTTYGSLVRNLDLSMLGGRWEKIGHAQLAPVLASCTHVKALDLDLCQHIKDSQMLRLFGDNPHLSENLTHLVLDEVMLTDQTLGAIIRMLPKLKHLHLSETNASYRTCEAIGSCLPDLLSLELTDCDDIGEDCIEKIAEGCLELDYLKLRGCVNIMSDIEDLMLEYDNHATISIGSDDDYETGDDIADEIHNGPFVGVLSRGGNFYEGYHLHDMDEEMSSDSEMSDSDE